ncbi:MAG: sugar ABC transporter permease [Lachnospiraceae bacterium]|nr:sugar ABC transporter permease [Lachnospiraceae bacterium]
METIKEKIGYKRWKKWKYFLLVLPFLIFVFAFSYVPLFGWAYAFFDYRPGKLFWDVDWAGLKHFQRLFTDSSIPRILRNTLVMSGLTLLSSPFPMFLAILLNDVKNVKIKKFIQTTTTLPHFISWVVVFGLAHGLFGATGLLNQLLKVLDIPTLEFGLIGDKNSTWVLQWMLGLWKTLGWDAILYMAAIVGIDGELYDAAKVDGANKLQLIRHITLPGMVPTFLVLLLLKVSNVLNNGFDQYFMFWNSLVADKIEVLDYYIYNVGLKTGQYSYSITVSMLKSLIGIVILFLANRVSKKLRGTSLV